MLSDAFLCQITLRDRDTPPLQRMLLASCTARFYQLKTMSINYLTHGSFFSLCTAKIHILSHITKKKLLAFPGFAHLLMLSTSCKPSSV